MSILKKTLMIGAMVAISACTNAGRFGDDAYGSGSAGSGAIVPGSANDPTSTAYFNQTVGDRVLFLVDQSNLSPEAQLVLDGQAKWLMTNADYVAVIEGHADEQGTREYNLALGERRANAAKNYLVSLGVDASRLGTISYGKERPVALGSNESAWAQNRRAASVVIN